MTLKNFFMMMMLFISSPVWAKSLFTYGTEIDFNSRYVWRGIAQSENPVIQPSAWISAKDFTFNLWANIDLTDEPDRKRFNEIDYEISYQKEWGKFDFGSSFIVYESPTQLDSPTTGEVALGITYSFEPFALTAQQFFDLIQYPGSYFGEFGLCYSHEWTKKLSWESQANIGIGSSKFNETYIGPSMNALNLFETDLALKYSPNPHLTLKPHVTLTALINGKLRSQVDDPTIVSGGLAFDTEW